MSTASAAQRRMITSPEGVPLRFLIGSGGERASAFVVDMAVIFGVMAFVGLCTALSSLGEETWMSAVLLLMLFLLRSFYFVLFELYWQGQTPGKRIMGLRVIDRAGGALSGEAIFVRNLMRELEVWLPMAFLLAPQMLWPGAPGWLRLACTGWLLVFAFMPLFNRDRLRVGDLVAGTLVVHAPQLKLLQDLTHEPEAQPELREDILFTPEQLLQYGVYELQVLEGLLRSDIPGRDEALWAVAEKVKLRIQWPRESWQVRPEPFLRAFYEAQRRDLERRMLFGDRQERKRGIDEE